MIFIEREFVAKTTRFDQKDHPITGMRYTEKCDKSGAIWSSAGICGTIGCPGREANSFLNDKL